MAKDGLTRMFSGTFNKRRYARHVARGDAARDNKDWPRAYTAYQDAVAISPDAAHIWVQLGHAAKELGQFNAAEKAYGTALDLIPDDTDVQIQLAHLCKEIGHSAKALALYKTALAAGAIDVHATEYLVRDAFAQASDARERRDYKSAAAFLREACELRADYNTWFQLGDCLGELGEYNEARQAFESALTFRPGDADCLQRIKQLDHTDLQSEPVTSNSGVAPAQPDAQSPPAMVIHDRRHARFSENVAVLLDRIQIAYTRRMA